MNRDTRDLVSILVDYTDGVALPVVIQSQFAGHQMDNAALEGVASIAVEITPPKAAVWRTFRIGRFVPNPDIASEATGSRSLNQYGFWPHTVTRWP
jgi:hypothetical protein